jgi:plasmid maintenance system antidote protein VapI
MKGMGCDRFPLGEILHDEFLKPLGLTVKEVSRGTAIRPGTFFKTSAEF